MDGEEKTARSIMARWGTVSLPELKQMFGDRIKWAKTTPKNRYIYFLGNKSQRRKLKKLLKHQIMPYPKWEKENGQIN